MLLYTSPGRLRIKGARWKKIWPKSSYKASSIVSSNILVGIICQVPVSSWPALRRVISRLVTYSIDSTRNTYRNFWLKAVERLRTLTTAKSFFDFSMPLDVWWRLTYIYIYINVDFARKTWSLNVFLAKSTVIMAVKKIYLVLMLIFIILPIL